MAFVEKVERGKNAYYHVTSSYRLPGGGWKKLRKYFGTSKPSEFQVARAELELQAQARKQGVSLKEDLWTIVEEGPSGPPGRWRPLTIMGGTILRFPHEIFMGIPSFGQSILHCQSGKVDWIMPSKAVQRAGNAAFRKVVEDPAWAEAVNERIENTSSAAFAYFESFPREFSQLSNSEIADLFDEAIEIIGDCQEVGQAWLALDFPHRAPLVDYLVRYLEKQNQGTGAGGFFSVLTTPLKRSNAQMEEISLVRLAAKIQADEETFALFTASKSFDSGFFAKFKEKKPRLWRLFSGHVKEFCWLPFVYEGPVWSEAQFAQTLSNLLKNRPKVKVLQDELATGSMALEEKQEHFLGQFNVDDKHARLLEIAREIVWGRGYRKDAIYHGFSRLLPLYEEAASRLGVSLEKARYYFWWEFGPALRGGKKLTALELDSRHKNFAVWSVDGKPVLYLGSDAQDFMKKIKLVSEEPIGAATELKGICASPGQGRGIVCIVNSAGDLQKMKEGSVLVSHATDPSLVVAMKKSSAIVTDMGGLASHAAVVSRELGVPCLVGTKIATKLLKDGELVHVDATHGILRRILAGE